MIAYNVNDDAMHIVTRGGEMKVFFDIFVAVLAVFGGYSALKLLSERFLIPSRFRPSVAMRLDGSEDDEFIAALTDGACAMWVHSRRVIILIPKSEAGDALVARVKKLCPSAYIIRIPGDDRLEC